MAGYDSVLDPRLSFEGDSIDLLLKPGHYDILYKGLNLANDSYDGGFGELIKIVSQAFDWWGRYSTTRRRRSARMRKQRCRTG